MQGVHAVKGNDWKQGWDSLKKMVLDMQTDYDAMYSNYNKIIDQNIREGWKI